MITGTCIRVLPLSAVWGLATEATQCGAHFVTNPFKTDNEESAVLRRMFRADQR
jgi:hypothetical protein